MAKITAAEFLDQAIKLSGRSQKEVAKEAGFNKPNFLSMMKIGDAKIPIDRVPALAKACGVEQQRMLQVVMEEYHPEIWEVLVSAAGYV